MEYTPAQILIAGKEKAQYLALSQDLKAAGHTVVFVETGHHAWSRLQTQAFDVFMLEVSLPDTSSDHLLERLRTECEASSASILMLLQPGETLQAERCLEAGADDVLIAPFSPLIAKKRIEHLVCLNTLRQELDQCQQKYGDTQKVADDLTEVILPVGIALSKIRDHDRLLERIVRETKSLCNADGGTLYLRDGEFLKFAIMLNDSLGITMTGENAHSHFPAPLRLHDEHSGEPNHTNVAVSTALLGISINIPDIYHVTNFDFTGARDFDRQYGYRSIASLTVPLKDHNGEVFGVLQLINPKDSQTGEVIGFNTYMQHVAEAMASQAALVLSHHLLLERQKDLLRYEDELKIGRRIQTSFLPDSIPQPPGWDIEARLQSASAVSGDFYDVFPLGNTRDICLVIADVCDKGVGAALFMVLIRTLIRAFAEYNMEESGSLGRVVGLTNDYILHNHIQTNMFATLFIGVLNPATGELSYVNGGHLAPLLIGSDGMKAQLDPTCPAVGAFPNMDAGVKRVTIEPGELLFAFTDGVTDARDSTGQPFTKENVLSLLNQSAASAGPLLDSIEQAIRQHIAGSTQFDDETMLAIKRLR